MKSQMFDIYACLARIASGTHYDALWENVIECLTHCDVDLISYTHVSPPHAADAGRIDTLIHGYPKGWVKLYLTEDMSTNDPLLGAACTQATPFQWSKVLNNPNLNLEQKKFTSQFTEWMKGDGYVFPVFGPSGRNGYMSLGNSASIQNWSIEHIHTLNMIAQTLHVRYSSLRIQELPSKFTLEESEYNLLKEIARGQSTKSIAELMGLTVDKVTSTLDMLILKMEVGDIPSLIIRGESLGLVKSNMK